MVPLEMSLYLLLFSFLKISFSSALKIFFWLSPVLYKTNSLLSLLFLKSRSAELTEESSDTLDKPLADISVLVVFCYYLREKSDESTRFLIGVGLGNTVGLF
jgi:hypothetical protein